MTEFSSENLIPFKQAGVITLEWLKEFARLSGDHNPIHQDEKIAREMGLPGVIAHGMLIAGLLHSRACEALIEYRNLRGYHIAHSQTRFRSMTLLGDEVSTGGQWQVSGSNQIRLELQARNKKGDITVSTFFTLEKGNPK